MEGLGRFGKKSLDFTVDLIPVISLLAVCIAFLLLSATWVHVGAMRVKQGLGGQPVSDSSQAPMIAVRWVGPDEVRIEPRNFTVKATIKAFKISPQWLVELRSWVAQLKSLQNNLEAAIIEPQKSLSYGDLIELMDALRDEGLSDVGVVPL